MAGWPTCAAPWMAVSKSPGRHSNGVFKSSGDAASMALTVSRSPWPAMTKPRMRSGVRSAMTALLGVGGKQVAG